LNQSGAPVFSMSCTGGPLGSTATIALIRFGRASATGQLNEPDCE
jgi:hypothetical protein